ncbi:MAG: RNA polymerase sigma factor [bacterium]
MDLFIQQLKNKDVKAFQSFFKTHYAELVHYANSFLYDINLSKDIVQESFVYLWENAGKLDLKTSATGYVKVMVKNKCLNYLKSIKITEGLEVLEFNANLTTEIKDVSEHKIEKVDLQQDLLKAIEGLPTEMKKIVELKFFQNYKYQEIADELNISINTVKTQLKRAKNKMHKALYLLLL